jgi:DHA1 family inner membrane transport protein
VGALLAMATGAFCFVAMETLPVGLLPLIAAGLHTSVAGAGMLVTGYGVTVAVMSLPLAYATRRVPRRLLLSVLLAVFVVATAASGLAGNYPELLGARIVVALSQSVFWSIAGPAAAGLFSVGVRGRAAATVFGGSALAPMLGVPAGTWLGQQAGWRAPFLALAGVGLIAFVALATLMPSRPAGTGHAAAGTHPSAQRYSLFVAVTILSVTGLFIPFTYTSPYLTQVAGFSALAVGPVLLLRGVVDLGGVVLGGLLVDRHPNLVLVGSLGLFAVSSVGMWAFSGSQVVVAATLAVSGFTLGAISPAQTQRILEVAPGNADVATAGASAAFNVGIAGGAAVGALVLDGWDLRATALVGGLVAAVSVAVAAVDPLLSRRARSREEPRPHAAAPGS